MVQPETENGIDGRGRAAPRTVVLGVSALRFQFPGPDLPDRPRWCWGEKKNAAALSPGGEEEQRRRSGRGTDLRGVGVGGGRGSGPGPGGSAPARPDSGGAGAGPPGGGRGFPLATKGPGAGSFLTAGA